MPNRSVNDNQQEGNRQMLRAVISGIVWLGLFVCAIVVPTLFFWAGDIPPPRSFWIELGVFLGFGLLMILALQFILTARFRGLGRPFGTDSVLQFHRHLGILTLVFLLGHPAILIIAKPKYLEFFDPRVNALRSIFLILATIAMILLVVLSVWRTAFKLNYEWWRLSHGLLAAGVVVVGMAHSWQVEHYVQGWGKRILLLAIGGSALGLLIHVRLWRPWRMRRYPYKIVDKRDEVGDSFTVAVTPEGHSGLTFRSGQYAWLTLGDSPFSLQQNPYSFSSSDQAAPQRLEFTAKILGDFSERLAQAKVGDSMFIEGPYGQFSLKDDELGAIFIMGGIGITPAMSILRSLSDKRDQRPLLLIYGNSKWEEVAFREELEQLEKQLNLKVIHVFSDPQPDWDGEQGYIDRELLERYIGDAQRCYAAFICGPEPMMDSVEDGLVEMEFPLHQTRAERFNMV